MTGAGVATPTLASRSARGAEVTPGAWVGAACGAMVGDGVTAGTGTGGAETTKSQSMSPPTP